MSLRQVGPQQKTAGPGRQPAPAPSTEGHVRYLGHGLGKTGPLALRQQEALFEKIALCSENLGTAAAFFFFYFFTLFQMLTPPQKSKTSLATELAFHQHFKRFLMHLATSLSAYAYAHETHT